MAQLLISQSYLTGSIIDNNVDFKKLTPIIELVQDVYIHPLLGTKLFNEIIEQSTPGGTLTGPNQTLLDDHILKTMMPYIIAKAPMSLKYRYMNKGVVSRNPEGSNQFEAQELKAQNDEWMSHAQLYAARMKNFIEAHAEDYPAYYNNSAADEESPRSGSQVDIYLPETSCDE